MTQTEESLKRLLERFDLLRLELQTARTDKQRRKVLTRVRILIAETDKLVHRELDLDSKSRKSARRLTTKPLPNPLRNRR
jgi:hypothetical protein